ncbi:hypothetical protein JX265_011295 [Neoarthrinium moseri]|uniref:Glycoside hydrolase family 76 protein n=1 Tax=Neoarthrinium moseri TaxID=1658444 RepID=A0A9P9WCT6_9PEZI|nr:hypothetical protein JX265_011295 [Neoarthrinium moseri]
MTYIRRAGPRLLACLPLFSILALGASSITTERECPVFFAGSRSCVPNAPRKFTPAGFARETSKQASAEPDLKVLAEVLETIDVMQNEYFAAWLGTWPDSIDWTGAVMGTHISGALHTFSQALPLMGPLAQGVDDWKLKENLIENYFAQVVSYYFGENAFEIRGEAFDDILWVVLGWLEAVKFVNTHTDLYYKLQTQNAALQTDGAIGTILGNQSWHGNLWVPAFSHRARIFWDLASHGWDTQLCGGGMTWNPRLLPYKNAITNELFIAGSISMYLYFPGDDNMSPFYNRTDKLNPSDPDASVHIGPRDPKFLKAAVDGYKWLAGSNMTNTQGLFTDGFHISGYANPASNNTRCDERNNMVFTYNQGVLLSGQRGLWEASGAASYLADGHKLIQNVINATGYDLIEDQPTEDYSTLAPSAIPKWFGLGRLGVMEDQCDASGTCSQDSQTFKGIFFHHLTYFCAPLLAPVPEAGLDVDVKAFDAVQQSHEEACASYGNWLKWNAEAAMGTRDARGRFGSWWTAGLLTNFTGVWPTVADDGIDHHSAGTDYRTYGVPDDTIWRGPSKDITDPREKWPINGPFGEEQRQQKPVSGPTKHAPMGELRKRQAPSSDPNRRGRGRTVETQGSGLALLRAYWNIAQAM